MGADSSTVRATVVQASTIFYDTPATLGNIIYCLVYMFQCVFMGSLLVIMHALWMSENRNRNIYDLPTMAFYCFFAQKIGFYLKGHR